MKTHHVFPPPPGHSNRVHDEIRNYGQSILEQEHADAADFNEHEAFGDNPHPHEPRALASSSRWDAFRAENDSAPEDGGCDAPAESETADAEYVLQLAASHAKHDKSAGGFKRDRNKRSYDDPASAFINHDPKSNQRGTNSAASFSRSESAHQSQQKNSDRNQWQRAPSEALTVAAVAAPATSSRDRVSSVDMNSGASGRGAVATNSRAARIPSSTAHVPLAALPQTASSTALAVPSNVRANSKWADFAAPEIVQDSVDENHSESLNQDAKRMRFSNASFAHALPSFSALKSSEVAAKPVVATAFTSHVPHFAAHSSRPSLSTVFVSDDELALLDF